MTIRLIGSSLLRGQGDGTAPSTVRSGGGTAGHPGRLRVYTPSTIPWSAPEIVNSGRGQYEWLDIPKDPDWWPDLVDEYTRDPIAWKIVEPSKGVYDFTVIEDFLAAAEARGGKFGFRVMPMLWITDTPLAPSWVPMTTGGGGTYPSWNDPTYVDSWVNLVTAIGNRFNGDPRLWFMDISGGGAFGEYYWDTSWGPDITPANALTIAQAAQSAFSDSFVLAPGIGPFMDNAIALGSNVGWRYDFAGCMEISTVPATENAWKTAPVVLEWCHNNTWTGATAVANVRELHASSVSSGNHLTRYAEMTPDDQALFIEAMKRAGFRYSLEYVGWPFTINSGEPTQLAVGITNYGSAPTYDVWRVELVLRAPGRTEWTVDLGIDLRTALSDGLAAMKLSTVHLPDGLSGNVAVWVRIVDTRSYLDPMRLATSGRDATGAYPAGSIYITP